MLHLLIAETEGFEPSEPLRAHRFSKPAPSATRPNLRRTMEQRLLRS